MAEGELEPLDPVLWFESLARLRQAVRRRESRIGNRLRQAYYLARLAPPPFSALVKCEMEEAAFEALLEEAALESAAVSLVGPILSFEITRAWPDHGVSARVWVEDLGGEGRSVSGCVASALIRAWIELLLQFRKRTPETGSLALHTGRRRSRSAQPRKLIWH